MARNSGPAWRVTSMRLPPSSISLPDDGTRLANATCGLSGPRESAKPISVAMTTG